MVLAISCEDTVSFLQPTKTATEPEGISARLHRVERQLRWNQRLGVLALLVATGVFTAGWKRGQSRVDDVIRARSLIIVDAQGRERIIVGAPLPGQRISPTAGLAIFDTAGSERFGVGLQAAGNMVMGFDAPPHTGDDHNRERINLDADAEGGAEIRMLDRHTLVRARLELDDDNRVSLVFVEPLPGELVMHRQNGAGARVDSISR